MDMSRSIKQDSRFGYLNPMADIAKAFKQATFINYTNPMTELAESLKKALEISYSIPLAKMSESFRMQTNLSYLNPMTDFVKAFKQSLENNYKNPMANISVNFQESIRALDMLQESIKPYSRIFLEFSKDLTILDSLSKLNLHELLCQTDIDTTDNRDSFDNLNESAIVLTDSESDELSSDIENIFTEKNNWQKKFVESLYKWKSRNPLIAYVFDKLIWIIIAAILTIAIESAGQVIVEKAAVRSAPSTQSIINNYVYNEQTIVIIESCPYFHKIQFHGSEDQADVIEGWVSKRSIKPFNKISIEE